MCKDKNGTPYVIDYKQDDLETIRQYEIKRLKPILKALNQAKRLCSKIGTQVIIEFGFNGDLEYVREQLSQKIEAYQAAKFKKTYRTTLLENHKRLKKAMQEDTKDFYEQTGITLIEQGNVLEAFRVAQVNHRRNKTLHDKKECLCYTNTI